MSVPDNYMDRWILSFTQSLIKFVKQEMAGEWASLSLSEFNCYIKFCMECFGYTLSS